MAHPMFRSNRFDGLSGSRIALPLKRARLAGRRISTGNPRTGGMAAIAMGVIGTVLAVLHLATADGGPGTGNGLVGAVVAVPLGLGALLLGRRAVTRSAARTGPPRG